MVGWSNHQAELLAEEMENRKRQRKEAGDCIVEEDILCETLGRRTGYSKGLGYGFIPSQSRNHSRMHNSNAMRTAQELLQEHQSWLVRQQKQIENQNSIIIEQKSTIGTMLENQKRLEENWPHLDVSKGCCRVLKFAMDDAQKMGLWTLLEGCLLIPNALDILNEDRFLDPRGWCFQEYYGVRKNS